jgi:hypothetical protein
LKRAAARLRAAHDLGIEWHTDRQDRIFMMTRFYFVFAFIALMTAQSTLAADVVFREPFTLRLHVDEEHYYEAEIDSVPYVHGEVIYLFAGDTFGVDLGLRNGAITELSYVAASEKADLGFEFRQIIREDGSQGMLLKITNNTKERISMHALMIVPEREDILETSILSLEPGLFGFEFWPHPIVQLALHELRTTP